MPQYYQSGLSDLIDRNIKYSSGNILGEALAGGYAGNLKGVEDKQEKLKKERMAQKDYMNTYMQLRDKGFDESTAESKSREISGVKGYSPINTFKEYEKQLTNEKEYETQKQTQELEKLQSEKMKIQADTKLSEAKAKDIEMKQTNKLLIQKNKAKTNLEQQIDNTKLLNNAFDKAIKQVSPLSAGFIGKPMTLFGGSKATDLKATISKIKASIGFDKLQALRDASPTGGALGQVSERELAFLQDVIASLNLEQSPSQLKDNLEIAKKEVNKSLQRVATAYERDFGEKIDLGQSNIDYNQSQYTQQEIDNLFKQAESGDKEAFKILDELNSKGVF